MRRFLELFGLWGLAGAQPILSVFGSAPDYFVFNGVSAGGIVTFGLVVVLAVPLALWAVTSLFPGRARDVAHATALGLLGAVAVAQFGSGPIIALAAGAAGLGLAVARLRWPLDWAAYLAPAPLLFLALFLFASPVQGLVVDDGVPTADLGAFASQEPPPIVMLVFDELPLAALMRSDGTIDADLYPNLAALAAASDWYPDTTTVANLTNFAMPAIVTGNRPQPGDSGDASTHPESLFTLLGGTYELDVTERITRVCPRALCGSSPPGGPVSGTSMVDDVRSVLAERVLGREGDELVTDAFVEVDEVVEEARRDTRSQNLDDLVATRPESLARFLDGIDGAEPPTLHFAHVLAPHTPHRHLPDGTAYEPDGSVRGIDPDTDRRSAAPWPALLDRQRLQSEAGYVDGLVGDVVRHLRAEGIFEDAMVVLTSDHGIAFRPGETVRGLGPGPVPAAAEPELLWVPLVIKAPGQLEGSVRRSVQAETIDIVPTMADALGIDLPWEVDGRSLREPAEPRRRRFHRIQGSSFATFTVHDAVPLRRRLSDVAALGVDSVLAGSGPDRWFRVGPFADLIGRPARGLGVVPSTIESGGPLVVAGVDLPDGTLVAVAAGDEVAAVVPVQPGGRVTAFVDPALPGPVTIRRTEGG